MEGDDRVGADATETSHPDSTRSARRRATGCSERTAECLSARDLRPGNAEGLRVDRDIQEFDLGIGDRGRTKFPEDNSYRRQKHRGS